jgi:hypothetical protein
VDKNLIIKWFATRVLWITMCIIVDNVDNYSDYCGYCGKVKNKLVN